MRSCKFCNRNFIPRSNRQKVCNSTECKKKLHNDRIYRYRKKIKEQNYESEIQSFVSSNKWSSLLDTANQLKINRQKTSYHINKLAKRGKIRQIHSGYIELEPIDSRYIFLLDKLKIDIQPHNDMKYYFCNYLEDEGLILDNDEMGNIIIKYKNLKNAVRICKRAYACVWAQLFSHKIYDQFYMEKNRNDMRYQFYIEKNRIDMKVRRAIGFFLHGFNRLSIAILSPKKPRCCYGPTFSQILTVEHIENKIADGKDVSNFLKRIYNEYSKQITHSNPEYEDLVELLDELLFFSDDKLVCNRICTALRKTINVHGEPILPIKGM